MSVSRNAPCPCGSGRKHKRCCLSVLERARQAARHDDAVGERTRVWAEVALAAELSAAEEEFGPHMPTSLAEIQLFASWFHSDLELGDGRTPAERYAERADLDEAERAAARRIAAARVGVYRVIEVEPGAWIELEDVVDGARRRVASHNVSGAVVRWDLIVGRVVERDPPGLWGATRVLEPSDEDELFERLAELERTQNLSGVTLRAAIRAHALELLRFRSRKGNVAPSFYTLEGDPIALGWARWTVRNQDAVATRVRSFGGLDRGAEPVIDITAPRSELVAQRGELPAGALVIEVGCCDDVDSVPVATLRLKGAALKVEAMSEERLLRAMKIVERDFGNLVEFDEYDVTPIDEALEEYSAREDGQARGSGLEPAEERRLLDRFLTERMRRWLDEPNQRLAGLTPRRAADGLMRPELEQLIRELENKAERDRRQGEAVGDLSWIREELGLADLIAA